MNTQEQELLLKRNAKLEQELASKDRELEIEAALEEVRSRSFAMHGSNELKDVVNIIFKKLHALNIVTDGGASIVTLIEDSKNSIVWVADPAHSSLCLNLPYPQSNFGEHILISDFWNARENGINFYSKAYSYEEKNTYFRYVFSVNGQIPADEKNNVLKSTNFAHSVALAKNTAITLSSFKGKLLSEVESKILRRFARVFDQAYVRFLDLQKVEAQTREVQIEAALERIRGKALAMEKSDDLFDVVNVLREQMGRLGQRELESSIVHLYNDDAETFNVWYAYRPPNLLAGEILTGSNSISKHSTQWAREVIALYKSPETEYTIVSSGDKICEWYKELEKFAPETIEYDNNGQIVVPEILYYYFSNFSGGSLLMVSNQAPSEESCELQKRAAAVFDLAYTRYLDLQKAEKLAQQAERDLIKLKEEKKRTENALAELKSTQAQLIQHEKMASLGELTTGIAHEIQNPLNFVNNFSDLNAELIAEMKDEIDKGNIDEVKAIADDLEENELKINHHGKRADAIVKGMLQHSRASSGKKEPTDLNDLADEYLRLSFHGLRAKDKDFNANFTTNFDESIGKLEVAPQDIGRVLLNLYNNAFYSVNEKKKQLNGPFEPSVEVSTKRVGNKVELSVKDNGMGIPQKILDKIFQPFFTTKPTGQGTGLGLSLSYDIIKAHGGEIKVETKDGEGTAFIIHLPIA